MSIPISVVVCTRNRVESLRRCVRALVSIVTDYEWELVVVDNGSNDGTENFLVSLPAQFRNVAVAFEPKRGLSAARNKGVSQANGDIVAFTDDDCYVAKNYIDTLVSAFEASEIGFVGGRVLLYDQSDLKITIQEKEDYVILQPRTFFVAGTIHGANMAFRKSVLNIIGGFDESLGAGTSLTSGEDTAAIAAALWAGITGAYDPQPTVYHHHGRKTQYEETRSHRASDIGRGAYYAKYILRSDLRYKYLRAWMGDVKWRTINARATGPVWPMGQLLRELYGALHYIAKRACDHFSPSNVYRRR